MLNNMIISKFDINLESDVGEAAFATEPRRRRLTYVEQEEQKQRSMRLITNAKTNLKSIVGEAASATEPRRRRYTYIEQEEPGNDEVYG